MDEEEVRSGMRGKIWRSMRGTIKREVEEKAGKRNERAE